MPRAKVAPGPLLLICQKALLATITPPMLACEKVTNVIACLRLGADPFW